CCPQQHQQRNDQALHLVDLVRLEPVMRLGRGTRGGTAHDLALQWAAHPSREAVMPKLSSNKLIWLCGAEGEMLSEGNYWGSCGRGSIPRAGSLTGKRA